MNNTKNIFQNTDCFAQEQLIRYVNGELTKAEARAVELHLADCEICFDAVEGLAITDKLDLEKVQMELQQRIQQKLKTEEQQKVIPLFKKWYSAVAAVLLVFLVSVYLVKLYVKQDNAGLAETKTEKAFQTNEPAKQINDESALRKDTITSSFTNKLTISENQPAQKQQIVASNALQAESDMPQEPSTFKSKEVVIDSDKKLAENSTDEVSSADDSGDNRNGLAVVSDETVTGTKDIATKQETKSLVALEKANAKPSKKETQKAEDKFVGISAPAANATGSTALSKSSDNNASFTFDYNLYDKGLNYFNAKDYNNALPVFNQLLAKQPDNINSNYYAGVSNYNLGNYAATIQHLNIVTNYKHNSLYESALWFKGNAFLKLDNKKEAKKTLEAVVKQKGNYKTQAEELLKGL